MLRDLALLCHDGSAEMQGQMQRLLRNLGVHAEVLALLRLNLNTKDAGASAVLEAAHTVLRDFMRGNPTNQAALFKDLGYFVNQAAKDVLAAQTATAIIQDNADLSARVPKSALDAVVAAIDTKGRQLSYIRFFRALLQVSGQTFKGVQNLVMDCLQSASEKVLMLCADETLFKQQLVPLLADPTRLRDAFVAEGNDLSYHLELIDVLTLCTEGRNVYTEIKCQVRKN